MKTVIQHACDQSATINSIVNLSSTYTSHAGGEGSLTNPSDASIYFSALLSKQIPLSTQAGIVGLLLVPCNEIEYFYEAGGGGKNGNAGGGGGVGRTCQKKRGDEYVLSPDLCHTYLLAVSTHVDSILEMWNLGRLDSKLFGNLMKAIRAAASICAEYKRSMISSSGILYALAKLASDNRRINRAITSIQDTSTTITTTTSNTELASSLSSSSLTQNILTQAHVEFLQCCILASQYNLAKQFVNDNPIYSVPTTKSALSSESFLRYFYFVGMVHLACDDYAQAITAFQQCMTVPSKVVSAITIEARKKLLCAKCLMLFHHDEDLFENSAQPDIRQNRSSSGSSEITGGGAAAAGSDKKSKKGEASSSIADIIFEVPNATSIAVMKSCSGKSFRHYEKLVRDFVSLDVTKFTTTVKEGRQVFTRDGNLGLVKQLLPLIQFRTLRKISKIYEAIPMSKLAIKLGFGDDSKGLNETESYLLNIALQQKSMSLSSTSHPSLSSSRNPIDFSIDSDSMVVYFYEVGYDDFDDPGRHAAQIELQNRVTKAMNLAERISKMDVAVTCSAQYQSCLASKNPEDCDEGSKVPSSVIDDM